MRECNHCGRVKPIEQFPRHRDHPEGRMSTCKECRNRRVREKRRRGEWKGQARAD